MNGQLTLFASLEQAEAPASNLAIPQIAGEQVGGSDAGSQAFRQFGKNESDIKRLLDLHRKEGGKGPGRRRGLEVLNKSAIVLITAFWEAYCEDVLSEALLYLTEHASNASLLPRDIRNRVATELKREENHQAVWSLSGDGWRTHLLERFDLMKEQRARKLNTPKATQIDDLFLTGLGLKNISESWLIAPGKDANWSREKLDKFVSLRGAIAHRGVDGDSVTKKLVDEYFSVIRRLVAKTDDAVKEHIEKALASNPW
ncbi:HEPN domain-containing protein [Palleronia pelagia]|uniref:RiboL-PSP-HEPN domain-containing protein n=1 Tax=Palleronia pelagia TaxID=387096 RepID=A0A1H8LQ63_9RHOB|nr:HEPN domain-containing protein [Palleronia pelagia]SEO07220.1 hypothetical protein SAMN04488011_11143 [Palleronia pelagia]